MIPSEKYTPSHRAHASLEDSDAGCLWGGESFFGMVYKASFAVSIQRSPWFSVITITDSPISRFVQTRHQNLASYLFLALYGVHLATTTLPCLVHLYTTPSCGFPTLDVLAKPCLFTSQRITLLLSYGAYLAIALFIALEVSIRCLLEQRRRND